MKKILKLALFGITLFFTQQVFAYEPDLPEETCKKPKFTAFSLPEFQAPDKTEEVRAGAEFSFVISAWAEPSTIKLTAKKKPLIFKVTNKNSFFLVQSKLPAEYVGQFVRINAQVNAKLGCKSTEGWLVKIAGSDQTTTQTPAAEKTTPPAPVAAQTPATETPTQ